jgi:predicted nucleotidyltransferase
MELDYQAIFNRLNNLAIDYVVVGGLAVNFHGIPRMTYDVDFMILLERENILKLISQLTSWGYRPRAPVDPKDLADVTQRTAWIQDKGMKSFNFYCDNQPIGEIDIIIESPIPYEELKNRAIAFEVQEEKVSVVSIQDLISLKIHAGRKQDISDVEHLKTIIDYGKSKG